MCICTHPLKVTQSRMLTNLASPLFFLGNVLHLLNLVIIFLVVVLDVLHLLNLHIMLDECAGVLALQSESGV